MSTLPAISTSSCCTIPTWTGPRTAPDPWLSGPLDELRLLDFSSWKGVRIPEAYGPRSEQFLTLPDLLDLLRAAGREIGLAIELKHPSPYQLKLEDRVLEVLRTEGGTPVHPCWTTSG